MNRTEYKRLSHHYRRYDYGRAMSAGTPREAYMAQQQLAFSRLLPGNTRRVTGFAEVCEGCRFIERAVLHRDDAELALRLS